MNGMLEVGALEPLPEDALSQCVLDRRCHCGGDLESMMDRGRRNDKEDKR
jgi:hypothetical protein